MKIFLAKDAGYCFGVRDAVNLASRMESSGISGKVHISESTKKFIPTSIKLVKREKVDLKNKGKFNTYIIKPKHT